MNRGVAKRVIFPDHAAKIRFITLIACSVRRGEMEVESLAVMDTHFHLLAYTLDGRIYYPMMRILNAYARYFNRRYKRDGSPFRGRFKSVPVLCDRHWHTLIRYIDFNAVKAGLVADPALYRYGTARLYVTRPRGPAWLHRSAVEGRVRTACGTSRFHGADYRRVFGLAPTQAEAEIMQKRIRRPAMEEDDLDVVDKLPPKRIAAWMRRKARLADGLSPWSPLVGAEIVLGLARREETRQEPRRVKTGRKAWLAGRILAAGLLHDAAGMSMEEIGRRLGCAASTAGRRVRAHRRALVGDAGYAMLAGGVLREALDATYSEGPLT
jgi:REP element-mobilizing transposase RayT